MALSLTAHQKNILKIFKIDEHYIIPEYQRPYSWEYEHCFKLYNDLIEGFNSSEDYFIGNLIIAKSENDNYELDVIDGQQRLTTIFLMIRILSLFTDDELFKNDFEKILGGMSRKTRKYEYRIKTEVFESNDENMIEDVLKYDKDKFEELIIEFTNKNGDFKVKNDFNKFQQNSLYFYYWFTNFQKSNKDIDSFIGYLLEKVYLLPIELQGKTKDEANEKALIIFETINNRGMNLEDADIFKAKLYKRAKNIGEQDIFIDLWKTFKNSCDNLKIDIDDVFRYYSHIIRGERGITVSEINLREFFTMKDYSPFSLKKYKEVMDDLNQIIEVLECINQEKQKESELSKWIQLIEAYTNQYPKIALVVYLFKNVNSKKLDYNVNVLESIVRYSYYYGSTTRVKFGIYTIIKNICNNKSIENYYEDVSIEYFDNLRNLKYGYALLAFYADKKMALPQYSIDKIISLKDKKILNWQDEDLYSFINSLGNFMVLDIPKKNLSLDKKVAYYQTSSNQYIEVDAKSLSSLDYNDFKIRDKILREKLVKFFRGEL